MKKILSLCLSVILFAGCIGLSVSAEEVTYPKVIHTYTSTGDLAEDAWVSVLRGAYLGSGSSSIARKDSTHINIAGTTTATMKADKLCLTLYVERSKSYSTGYTTYKYYDYSISDEFELAKAISNIYVERGYYYRVKGVHSVTEGKTTETTDSVTNPLDYT